MARSFIPVGHGQLEALLEEAGSDSDSGERGASARAAAVVCHPHPSFGGTMHNNVVYRMARVLRRHGVTTLRFNFRGVGTSTGVHADGVGEREDVTAAIDWLAAQSPGLPLWVAGFSFGARVGLDVGTRDARVARLLGAGLVPKMFDFSFLLGCRKPKALVHGERDELGDLAAVQAIFDGMPPPKHLVVIPDAAHLFPGKLDELESGVDRAVTWLAAEPA